MMRSNHRSRAAAWVIPPALIAVLSLASCVGEVLVGAAPKVAPDAPTISSVSPASGQVTISFTFSTVSAKAPSYTATCTATGAADATQSGTASPLIVTGMTNGTQYSCTVVASNAAGDSPASNALSVTPAGAPDAPVI